MFEQPGVAVDAPRAGAGLSWPCWASLVATHAVAVAALSGRTRPPDERLGSAQAALEAGARGLRPRSGRPTS